jgi:hypothetical protein
MRDLTKALLSLRPGAAWSLDGDQYEGLVWLDQQQSKPTKEELTLEADRLQAEYDAKEYQRIRAIQYPSIANQLDMLWHAMNTGALPKVDSFYDAIKAVKDANPKP